VRRRTRQAPKSNQKSFTTREVAKLGSRVKAKLTVSDDGRVVAVTGPITKWEGDEESATFTVVIAQVDGDGDIILARGESEYTYRKGAKRWEATARVNGRGGRLKRGMAQAWALASITKSDGEFELYPWSVKTSLVVG
jgi:hypothetical protein